MSQLPSASTPVPVFNCIVNVTRAGPDGMVIASVANLAAIEGRGLSEREALGQVVSAFKQAVARYHAAGEAIPWIEPPAAPKADQIQRLIAVHL